MKRGLLGVVAAAALLWLVPSPVGALESTEVFTVYWDKDTTAEYPPIGANNALFVANPPHCQLFPDCTLVPVTIVHPPGGAPEDDFIVEISVSWPDAETDVGGANDLDIYVWLVKEMYTAEEEPVGKSAGAENPEVAKLYRPVNENYWLAVNNFTGANVGFTVSAKYIRYPTSTPFELLEPPVPAARQDEAVPPVDNSLDLAPPGGLDVGAPVDLARLPVSDPAFDFARPLDAAELSTPPPLDTRALARSEPDEPSGAALAVALGVVPAGLLGTSALLVLRRRPAALRIR